MAKNEDVTRLGEAFDYVEDLDFPIGYQRQRRIRGLLTFRWADGVFIGETQRAFLPRGLIVWGAPDGATVQIFISADLQVTVTCEPAPVKFFSSFDSFEQIAKAWEAGKEPPNWCTWKALYPGVIVRLRFSDLDYHELPRGSIQSVMWGHAVI